MNLSTETIQNPKQTIKHSASRSQLDKTQESSFNSYMLVDIPDTYTVCKQSTNSAVKEVQPFDKSQ